MRRPEKRIFIGRDRGCDIGLVHETVSARHAELRFLDDGRLLLTDCKSRNGTWLQTPDGRERPVHQELVSPTDHVQFGQVSLSVQELLGALRQKGVQPDSPPPRGRNLERCDCGCIKPAGQRCPECGR